MSINLLALEHVASLHTLAADPAVAALMGVAHPVSLEAVQRYVEQQLQDRAAGRTHVFAIKNRNDVVGVSKLHGLYETEPPQLTGWIAPAHRGKGYATFGMRMTLQFAFQNLRLARVKSVALKSNTAARRVAFKNGFKFLCVQSCHDRAGETSNHELQAVCEITRSQWLELSHAPALARLHPALQRILQAELAAGNEVGETGGGWPEAGSVLVKLRSRFRTRPAPLPDGIIYTEPKSPHWWPADYSAGTPAHILACGEK